MALTLSIVVHVVHPARHRRARRTGELGPSAAARCKLALPALVLPLLIVGGIRYGVFSATEAGAVAALYAVLCGVLRLSRGERRDAAAGAARGAGRNGDGHGRHRGVGAVRLRAGHRAGAAEARRRDGDAAGSWILLLLVINVFLLFVGLAMEMIASMVILVPLLVPMLKAANIDLVHFGIVMVANLCIGALTPPLAVLVFTAARVTDTPIHLAYRACRPFMVGLLVWLAIITFVPALSLVPVRLFGP